jgi:hypothetical protein
VKILGWKVPTIADSLEKSMPRLPVLTMAPQSSVAEFAKKAGNSQLFRIS